MQVDCTEEVDYLSPPHLIWVNKSKSGTGTELSGSCSVLPSRRCRSGNVSFSPCGFAFAFQQGGQVVCLEANGAPLCSIPCPYRASVICFSPDSFPNFLLLLVASFSNGLVDVWSIPKDPLSRETPESLLQLKLGLRLLSEARSSPLDEKVGLEAVWWVPLAKHNSTTERYPSLLLITEQGTR